MPNRLEPVPIEEIEDAELRKMAKANYENTGDHLFLPTLGSRIPQLTKSFFNFFTQFYKDGGPFDLTTLELMRTKCYSVNECRL